MGNYHSGIERITSSGLKILMHKSPAHYYAKYADAVPDVPTRSKAVSYTHLTLPTILLV